MWDCYAKHTSTLFLYLLATPLKTVHSLKYMKTSNCYVPTWTWPHSWLVQGQRRDPTQSSKSFPWNFFCLTWDLHNYQAFPAQWLKLWDVIAVKGLVSQCAEKNDQHWEKMEASVDRSPNKSWNSLIPLIPSSNCSRCKLSCEPVLFVVTQTSLDSEPINLPFSLN